MDEKAKRHTLRAWNKLEFESLVTLDEQGREVIKGSAVQMVRDMMHELYKDIAEFEKELLDMRRVLEAMTNAKKE